MKIALQLIAALALVAPAAWPCSNGSACTFNLKNATASGGTYGSLQDGGSIGSAVTSGVYQGCASAGPGGWDMVWNGLQDSFGSSSSEQPNGAATDGWRSESTLTGTIAAGTWTWKVKVNQSGSTAVQICTKIWKSTNANLTSTTGATQIGTRQCSTSSTAAGFVQHTANFTTGGATTLTNEYIYIIASWNDSLGAGSCTGTDGTVYVDSANSNLVTPTFTIPVTTPPTSILNLIN